MAGDRTPTPPPPPFVGVVADDLTGANDIGAFFSAAGFPTYVFTSADAAREALPEAPDARAVIVDTASRYDDPETAYRKVAHAVALLTAAGATRFYKKTCSVFRGNVGREFDAMLDALGRDFAVVVSGYPRNRRTMEHGIQYVAGTPLAESHFARDPFQPTTDSNLVNVLRSETARPVCLVDMEVVARGVEEVRASIARRRAECAYLMLDVPDEAALRTIARAVAAETVFGGAAGLAGELAPLWNPGGLPCALPSLPRNYGLGVPVVSGSLTPVTERQVAALAETGAMVVEMNAARLLDEETRAGEITRAVERAAQAVRSGRDAAVVSPNDPERIAAARAAARARGLAPLDAGRAISDAAGAIAAGILHATSQNRMVLCGGETAAAVCRSIGVRGLRIGPALEPGIPVCDTVGSDPLRLVLKGGSMGADDILIRAVTQM